VANCRFGDLFHRTTLKLIERHIKKYYIEVISEMSNNVKLGRLVRIFHLRKFNAIHRKTLSVSITLL